MIWIGSLDKNFILLVSNAFLQDLLPSVSFALLSSAFVQSVSLPVIIGAMLFETPHAHFCSCVVTPEGERHLVNLMVHMRLVWQWQLAHLLFVWRDFQ
jgi:hypothetical protein